MNRTETAAQTIKPRRSVVFQLASNISFYLMAFTTGLLVGLGTGPDFGVMLSLACTAVSLVLVAVMVCLDVRSRYQAEAAE